LVASPVKSEFLVEASTFFSSFYTILHPSDLLSS